MGPDGWLGDTLRLYGRVFRRAATLTARNWSAGLAVLGYALILRVALALVAPLGPLVGGFVLYLVLMGCMSSWLAILAQVVGQGRVHWSEIPQGFVAYLNDLLTVGFILWGLRLIASLVFAPFPLLQIVFGLALVTFLNAVPELIYLGRHAPAELVVASYRFIAENWIEWFPPTIACGALFAAILVAAPPGPLEIVATVVASVAWLYLWVARGLLFEEMGQSSRRSRAFRRLAGS